MVTFIALVAAALSCFQINMVVAAPHLMPRSTLCNLSAASHLDFLPADLPQPSKAPGFVGIGVGFQNYTCEDGKYSQVSLQIALHYSADLYSTALEVLLPSSSTRPASLVNQSTRQSLTNLSPNGRNLQVPNELQSKRLVTSGPGRPTLC